jgi:hypothetical protein
MNFLCGSLCGENVTVVWHKATEFYHFVAKIRVEGRRVTAQNRYVDYMIIIHFILEKCGKAHRNHFVTIQWLKWLLRLAFYNMAWENSTL